MKLECEDQELLEGFVTESTELLQKLDDDLVNLEKSPRDNELLNRVFRSIHTVKGTSSFLGFELLVQVTHKIEDVLNRLRKGDLLLTSEIMDVILEGADLVKLLVNDIAEGELRDRPVEETIGKLSPFLSDNSGEASCLKKEATATCEVARENPPPVETAIREPATTETPAEAAGKPRSDESSESASVRVDVKRLDDLMNQVGELVLERNRMLQLSSEQQNGVNRLEFVREFNSLSKRMNYITSELQMQVLKMRMIPVEKIFRKFPRIVRNLARDLGKEVELHLVGEETELDRSILEELGDPLVHLVRNALDHGLERPDERIANGKTAGGALVLSAEHEGNHIVIRIKDDGRGIDHEKVSQKALEKGVVTEAQLANMGKREILDLIFLPGFSTKETASDISGRGVGMDVVKTYIKKMNGIIEVRSTVGSGTEFIIRLPLTLAIIQTLLVGVGKETYSIPLSSVLETLRVENGSFHRVGGQEVLRLREEILPLLKLDRLFNNDDDAGEKLFCYVVVVGAAERRLGLVVSRLLGQQEVVIKSLGRYLGTIPGFAGSTILGDGQVALIVDPVGLIGGYDGSYLPGMQAM